MKGKEIVSVKVVSAIEIISTRGDGTDADPVRPVTSYWLVGNPCKKIAEFDPINEDQLFQRHQI